MKSTLILPFLLGSVFTLAVLTQSPEAYAQDPPTSESAGDEPETELEAQMLRVKDAMRLLRRTIRKAESRSESLALVQECQEAMILAKPYKPIMLKNVPADKQAAFVRDYRVDMIAATRVYLDLEEAILLEKDDLAQDLYKKAKGTEDPAHERFTEDG